MGKLQAKEDYENLRKARILENQARLAKLGLQKTISELRSVASSAKSTKRHVRNYSKKVYEIESPRRSNRLKQTSPEETPIYTTKLRRSYRLRGHPHEPISGKVCDFEGSALKNEKDKIRPSPRSYRLRGHPHEPISGKVCDFEGSALKNEKDKIRPSPRSYRLRGHPHEPISGKVCDFEGSALKNEKDKIRPANMPLVLAKGSELQLSPEASARRCSSRGRGGVYDPIFGICCHFCRQKKLCGEEDCKRCGNLDVDQPCIGKTDCSVCHSSNGVLCRGCLKVRYGEEMEEVRENKEWTCPHCIEEKGINPYWICNSSICLKRRKMAPTGIAIYRAQELGYKSVAHLLMDELQGKIKC